MSKETPDTREALEEAAEQYADLEHYMNCGFDRQVAFKAGAIWQSTRQTEEQRWISAEERLPKHNERVIGFITEDNHNAEITLFIILDLHFQNGEFFDSLDNIYQPNVTHWQPLPSPPKNALNVKP